MFDKIYKRVLQKFDWFSYLLDDGITTLFDTRLILSLLSLLTLNLKPLTPSLKPTKNIQSMTAMTTNQQDLIHRKFARQEIVDIFAQSSYLPTLVDGTRANPMTLKEVMNLQARKAGNWLQEEEIKLYNLWRKWCFEQLGASSLRSRAWTELRNSMFKRKPTDTSLENNDVIVIEDDSEDEEDSRLIRGAGGERLICCAGGESETRFHVRSKDHWPKNFVRSNHSKFGANGRFLKALFAGHQGKQSNDDFDTRVAEHSRGRFLVKH